MSMTIQQVATRLLFRIGVTSLDPNVNANSANQMGIDVVNDVAEVVEAINGALQEVWGLGPTEIRQSRMSFQLFPPTAVSVGVTQYGTAITGLSPSLSWMPGCTIRIAGDGLDNELVTASQLLRPFQGGTGTASATMFSDCINMPSNVSNVIETVKIPTILAPLTPAASREDFEGTQRWYGHHSRPTTDAYYAAQNKVTGEPRVWFAEPRYDPTLQYLPISLRLNPMPGQPYPLTACVKLKPPTVSADDVGTVSADPGTIIPQDWNESIILPVAMKRFALHPAFASRPEAVAEIGRQFDRAMVLLEALAPMIAGQYGQYNF